MVDTEFCSKMCDKRISDLVKFVTTNQNFIEYKLKVLGKTARGDGYLGKVTFVTITGETSNAEKKELNLVIKTSGQNELLRSEIPIKQFFESEIYIYDEVVPTFRNFQREMGFKGEALELLPYCYLTQNIENEEALILENLKVQEFDVANRKIPLTFDHFKLVLESYGKWDALALALRHKRPDSFKHLTKNIGNMWSTYISQTKLEHTFFRYYEEVRKFWENDEDVASVKFSEDEVKFILTSLVFDDLDCGVILHGDSWTNNFLFKEVSNKPTQISIIDWQLSGLGSPIIDVSHFIYVCVDTGKYKNVIQLLEIYYGALSLHLQKLHCNPEDVLPFSTLVKHWRKFSCYGLLFGSFNLRFALSESEELPDLEETAEKGHSFLENFDYKPSNPEPYYKRVKNNILHYARNLAE